MNLLNKIFGTYVRVGCQSWLAKLYEAVLQVCTFFIVLNFDICAYLCLSTPYSVKLNFISFFGVLMDYPIYTSLKLSI